MQQEEPPPHKTSQPRRRKEQGLLRQGKNLTVRNGPIYSVSFGKCFSPEKGVTALRKMISKFVPKNFGLSPCIFRRAPVEKVVGALRKTLTALKMLATMVIRT